MNGFVDKIIELLRTTSLTEIYSPFLVAEETSIGAVQIRPGGFSQEGLSNTVLYRGINFNVLIRGTESDSVSMGLAEEVFDKLKNVLNLSYTDGRIVHIKLDPPELVDRDENRNLVYNVNGFAEIQKV